jgi:hypothetical protein
MANPTDHYLLTGLDVHGTFWKTVDDAAALAALTPIADDVGKDVLQADNSTVHKLVSSGPAVWKDITAGAGGGVNNWIALVDTDPTSFSGEAGRFVRVNGTNDGLEFTDAPTGGGDLTSDGTTAQDAALFTERSDHVNTPTTGFAEIWVKDVAPTVPMFTDDTDVDHQIDGDVIGPASALGNSLALWNGASGKLLKDPAGQVGYVGSVLYLTGPHIVRMGESATLPYAVGTGNGGYWVRNDTPTVPMFTDDDDVDHQLAPATGKTTAPGTGDNGAAGYPVGSIWVDETNDDAYISLDASTTAVWKKMTP